MLFGGGSVRYVAAMRALALTAVLLLASCGTTSQTCNASSCTGCCDASGACQQGGSNATCGSGGGLCQFCTSVQACTFGVCITQNGSTGGGVGTSGGGVGTTGGGSGATGGGGSAMTGGGTGTTGGGAATTGGGSGTTGGGSGQTCSPTLCPQGCCTESGVCITNTTPGRCGSGGNACAQCVQGQTCNSGACTTCSGCIDVSTGTCVTGNAQTACGRNGGFCQSCGTSACTNGVCANPPSCGPGNCAGCCDGNTCFTTSQMSNARCGQGSAGQQCVACMGTNTCSTAGAGQCISSGSGGGGGGSLPDASLPFCDPATNPCPSGQCCDGAGSGFGICVGLGAECQLSAFTNPTCLLTPCACKSSGVCAP